MLTVFPPFLFSRWTSVMIALPILLYTSYALYQRGEKTPQFSRIIFLEKGNGNENGPPIPLRIAMHLTDPKETTAFIGEQPRALPGTNSFSGSSISAGAATSAPSTSGSKGDESGA
jgi:hypothetical protein